MKSPKKRWFIFTGVGVLLSCICVAVVGFSVFSFSQLDPPTQYNDVHVNAVTIASYTFTPEQQAVIDQRGNPDGFLILFYDETLDTGQVIPIRQESWYYYNSGYEITFKNGETFSQEATTPYPTATTRYSPSIFTADMSLAQILAATGLDSFLLAPVEEELVPNSELAYLEGLSCGLVDGKLRYIESVTIDE